ncbi:hypothetical protein [Elizabethkingia anophelis]|uniref:hypothetical protein n=1 Tax=Elizabethkingia anophelis TaxID=1117645 RepID=UPI000999AF29|nr:hypothetical protein [Elizabethkingia anophelis]OPC39228.1 hypothetical protein BAY02_09970 [Elizabethkingia anophelis]
MKNLTKLTFALFAFMLLFIACSKDDDDGKNKPSSAEIDIYISGNGRNYWKNGQEFFVPHMPQYQGDNSTSAIMNMFVNGNDVHFAGVLSAVSWTAIYWKNNNPIRLEEYGNNSFQSRAEGIYAKGNDLYVCGWSYLQGEKRRAKYWKNGIATVLTDGTKEAWVTSILAEGDDVYVTGYEDYKAVYWKNNVKHELPEGNNAEQIIIHNGDVYILGLGYVDINANNGPKKIIVWKNGVANIVDEGRYNVTGMFIDNNDIYISGEESTNSNSNNYVRSAIYWKNGQKTVLTTNTEARTSGIAVNNEDVYVSGTEGDKPVYWKNRERVDLNFTGDYASTTAIQIVNK